MDTEVQNEDADDDNMDTGQANRSSINLMDFKDSHLGNSFAPHPTSLGQRKSVFSNLSSPKRPKLDEGRAARAPVTKLQSSPTKVSPMPSIVHDLASRSRVVSVDEPGDLVINTEDEISRIYDGVKQAELGNADFRVTLSEVSGNLVAIWRSFTRQNRLPRSYGAGSAIGPGDGASNIDKAVFLSSLLMQLHHPPLSTVTSNSLFSHGALLAPRSLIPDTRREPTFVPIPRFLLDWLNTSHVPQADGLQNLRDVQPNPVASSEFWDIVNAAVLRGHLSEVAGVLRSADFSYARSALEDGLPQTGYRGAQLQNIQRCVNKALQILEACPGVHQNDWDIKSIQWALYRKRVLTAITDLEEFAEGDERQTLEPPTKTPSFQAANFGLTSKAPQSNFSFTESSRMAESRVPWTIYRNLRSLYLILLGDTSAITTHSQDWVEATVALAVWWDGDDESETSQDSNSVFVAGSRTDRSPAMPRAVDDDPVGAYLQRLNLSFGSVTVESSTDASFRVNTLNSLEVGLACVFEGNIEGVVELLQTWSLCIASAVAEVASAGGWLETDSREKQPSGLNESDLMVLSYGQDDGVPASRIRKDNVLSAYAWGLYERTSVQAKSVVKDGWEIALEILSRLDDTDKMQKSVTELVDKLPLDTSEQMDKVVLLCSDLGLDKEGRRVSERYGDLTVSKSDEYGLALVCYARAHNRRKVKSVVDLLISYSLVQSRAYPAGSELDEQLRSLIREPKACLSAIAEADDEAARILQFYFSGYATLRRFYEVRDEAVTLKDGQKPRFRPLARRRAAARALVAVISSAADGIYGGLYDPDRDAAVQVDGLLALLGEALVFLEQPSPVLSVSQLFTILSAVEDLETVTPRVYAQCEECFRSTLIEYHQSRRATRADRSASLVLPPSPRALLKKSVSSATASSSFSLIGSDMIESARGQSGPGSIGGSTVLVSHPDDGEREQGCFERGWDWRAGLSEDASGQDVLRILRLGLAKGLSLRALGSV